jgi:hypothetical protein
VAQEAVRLDLEVEVVASLDPARGQHLAAQNLVLRLCRRERAEVLLADEKAGGALELPDVERPRHPPAATCLERRGRAAAEDPVPVGP